MVVNLTSKERSRISSVVTADAVLCNRDFEPIEHRIWENENGNTAKQLT